MLSFECPCSLDPSRFHVMDQSIDILVIGNCLSAETSMCYVLIWGDISQGLMHKYVNIDSFLGLTANRMPGCLRRFLNRIDMFKLK